MAISHELAPMPIWPMINNLGTLADGAKLYTYSNLNKVDPKAVYQDPAGTISYTNPIVFDGNGTRGPFYWTVDSATPDDTYYLEAFDKDDNLLWTIENFAPVTGGGGGSSSTTHLSLRNLISNNVFLDHIDDLANPLTTTNVVLAPSNHRRFTPDQVPVVGTFGGVGPDFRFVKNNTAATDAITFESFQLGLDPLNGDVTPETYIRYVCTNSPVGETYKSFQWPIIQGVNNLDNTTVTYKIWAKVKSTPVNLVLYTRQYFGSGGSPSAEVRELKATLALTTDWTPFVVTFSVPNTTGKVLGDCGDDALYLQLEMPLGDPANVCFTKPSLFVGAVNPTYTFDTYDHINSIVCAPRTGDIRVSINAVNSLGWIPAINGTIGSGSSNATLRAKLDTFPLFGTIWNIMNGNPKYAPIYDSTGAASTYGASAIADFVANKQLAVTQTLAKALAGTGPDTPTSQTFTVNISNEQLAITSAQQYGTSALVTVSNSGGALPSPLVADTLYYTIFVDATHIQLAENIEDALAGTAINITSVGTGTHSILAYTPGSGVFTGRDRHQLTTGQMPTHAHGNTAAANAITGTSGPNAGTERVSLNTLTAGGDEAHPNTPPTIYMNMYFKL